MKKRDHVVRLLIQGPGYWCWCCGCGGPLPSVATPWSPRRTPRPRGPLQGTWPFAARRRRPRKRPRYRMPVRSWTVRRNSNFARPPPAGPVSDSPSVCLRGNEGGEIVLSTRPRSFATRESPRSARSEPSHQSRIRNALFATCLTQRAAFSTPGVDSQATNLVHGGLLCGAVPGSHPDRDAPDAGLLNTGGRIRLPLDEGFPGLY